MTVRFGALVQLQPAIFTQVQNVKRGKTSQVVETDIARMFSDDVSRLVLDTTSNNIVISGHKKRDKKYEFRVDVIGKKLGKIIQELTIMLPTSVKENPKYSLADAKITILNKVLHLSDAISQLRPGALH